MTGRPSARTYRCPSDHKHGETATCYDQHECGCDECRDSRRDYQFWRDNLRRAGKWDRAHSVDGAGTRRRMQALAFMGWPSKVLANRLGTAQAQTHALLRKERVSPATAERVRRVFEECWNQEPPGGRRVYTMNRARREGWVGPLAWDDDIDVPTAVPADTPPTLQTVPESDEQLDYTAIEEALSGRQPDLSPAERRAVVTTLNARKWSSRRIARHIGCAARTVDRIRTELGLPVYDQMEIRDAA